MEETSIKDLIVGNKDKKLVDLKKSLKAAKTECQKLAQENKYLKEYIITNKKRRA